MNTTDEQDGCGIQRMERWKAAWVEDRYVTGDCCDLSDSRVMLRPRRGQRQSVLSMERRGNCAVQSRSSVYRCKKPMRALFQPSLSHLVSECQGRSIRTVLIAL